MIFGAFKHSTTRRDGVQLGGKGVVQVFIVGGVRLGLGYICSAFAATQLEP